jgi:hypothetical protein
MPRQWNKTESFGHFGAAMTNTRWSWSGVSPDGGVVVVVLWQDVVKGRDGRLTYADEDDLDADWRRRPGHSERIEHLRHCRDNLEGRFRAVIARAVNVNADPRDIAACHPQQGVWWQLDHLDEETGAFRAHVLPRSGPSDMARA